MKCEKCGKEYPSKFYFATPTLCTDCFQKMTAVSISKEEKSCPECKSSMLEKRDLGITIDECTHCRGIWFDPGELEAYRLAKGEKQEASKTTLSRFKALSNYHYLMCPICASATLQCGSADDLQIARCTQCTGIYVGKKEVIKIAKSRKFKMLDGDGEGKAWIGASVLELIWEFVDW